MHRGRGGEDADLLRPADDPLDRRGVGDKNIRFTNVALDTVPAVPHRAGPARELRQLHRHPEPLERAPWVHSVVPHRGEVRVRNLGAVDVPSPVGKFGARLLRQREGRVHLKEIVVLEIRDETFQAHIAREVRHQPRALEVRGRDGQCREEPAPLGVGIHLACFCRVAHPARRGGVCALHIGEARAGRARVDVRAAPAAVARVCGRRGRARATFGIRELLPKVLAREGHEVVRALAARREKVAATI
mmetsp:Transcript_38774/g.123164  ORF Transcript_38774/g.123164 Transcript_38774/m.123164 type:complete len:246 (+) Transcript_38774:3448-4185(+)